ncbi:methionine synthase II (cobalamin-independent)|uniref:Methionine synthase II (Cobalamin-independent) n=1 Tax=Brenneria salicis ATCC 15712 = DSM 30166 TaxID=714314 RepID=A0A366HWF0_9GAMM|nr:5-methyltetrahydropteroyltriglutamate--homocysteine methyltransferase [Brenneria salicis]NMN93284.1 methionine synthase II (cobalamin-independent) [Brenneria salicis ATCC 15712 = DSM 30166]RBP57561.1 methionine synthase II (cobalamin-independent) [Brenneria salicis ATCC 15712 = DSM 30166]RLM31609.1 5-methyltetrahydropteroyltriglutamate--homocysteine methyltransferase [Brenneria salicis ATCC 15712 = DSM 30166]
MATSYSPIPPFRADVVGSYLRPAYLHEARSQLARGELTAEALKTIEDKAITELVEKQKRAGLQVITDGEFRRSWWHLDFMWALNGVEKTSISKGYVFADKETRAETGRLTGKLSGENHMFVEHFKFLLQFTEPGIVPRMTIPAPAQFLAELQRPDNKALTTSIYPSEDELVADIARAYRTFIQEIYAAGCRNLQLDDCTWGMLVDPKFAGAGAADTPKSTDDGCGCGHSHVEAPNNNVSALAELYLKVNNAAIEGAPADLALTTHVCRGNYHSSWAARGDYQPVAGVLFARENVAAYYLEFDTERSGDFSPLTQVSGNKQVVLGLISSKVGELEDKQAVIDRIHEASRYVPLERLCLSTQCGFASTEEGNILTEEQQWAKIALVKTIADEVWG